MTGAQTTLYLVRHAHSPYVPNKETERGLSEQGRRDASRVTEVLTQHNIDVVISSPYARAIETVQETAAATNTELIIKSEFRERRLAGSHVDDFEEAISKVWENTSFSWEGGESNESAQRRSIEAVRQVVERWNGARIVIGTHGNILALILNYYDRSYDYEFWKQLTMPDIYQVTFREGGSPHIERGWSV